MTKKRKFKKGDKVYINNWETHKFDLYGTILNWEKSYNAFKIYVPSENIRNPNFYRYEEDIKFVETATEKLIKKWVMG